MDPTRLCPLLINASSYKDEFTRQYGYYEHQHAVFLQAPSSTTDTGLVLFRDLIDFVSHVADCYPDITTEFPNDLINLLTHHHNDLDSELRSKIVGSLVLIRRKEIIDSSLLVPRLYSTHRISTKAWQTPKDTLPDSFIDAE